jgi:hypothetical protein
MNSSSAPYRRFIMSDWKEALTPWIGILAIAVFVVFVFFLIYHASDDDGKWSRYLYVFGAVEAVAFSAFGFFFGKEVNRDSAKNLQTALDRGRNADSELARVQERLHAVKHLIDEKLSLRASDPDWKELEGLFKHLNRG